ncbi:hypothetical protein RRG08_005045 [Elysia crispata]|uniref:Uncharacterized protein n=1 Tax=Elysia crispata TaxID=231223 RepID=A0AAE0XZK6_9GAST|nr:hypothetical protein RRG08_005045 [Elysia crispata]
MGSRFFSPQAISTYKLRPTPRHRRNIGDKTMLPKSEGPTSVKRIKLPQLKKDILDLVESNVIGNEETQKIQAENDTVETTTSNDSIICGSYGSSLDLGYASNEGSLPIDLETSVTGSDINDLPGKELENKFSDEALRTGDCGADFDYDSILFQFDAFFRGKLDAELAVFQENMHSMLTEQQIHLQKIISSASQNNFCEGDTEGTSIGSAVTTDETSAVDETREFRCVCQESQKKAKNSFMIELLSLSCQLTELLNQKKFKCHDKS